MAVGVGVGWFWLLQYRIYIGYPRETRLIFAIKTYIYDEYFCKIYENICSSKIYRKHWWNGVGPCRQPVSRAPVPPYCESNVSAHSRRHHPGSTLQGTDQDQDGISRVPQVAMNNPENPDIQDAEIPHCATKLIQYSWLELLNIQKSTDLPIARTVKKSLFEHSIWKPRTLQTPFNNVSANSNITVPYRGDFRKNGPSYLSTRASLPKSVFWTVNLLKTRQPLSKITLLIMILMCFVWLKLGLVQTAEIELLKKT